MLIIEIAGLVIKIHNKYPFVEKICRDYILSGANQDICADMEISVSEESIDKELKVSGKSVRGYAEAACIYREISNKLSDFDAILLHSAVIEKEGKAYAFAAASGTGKTTHIGLWKKRFGESVRIINGDKPIVRILGGIPYVYGTPWCGKEGWNINTKAPLSAICFYERALPDSEGEKPICHIRRAGAEETVSKIFTQIIVPTDPILAIGTLDVLDRLLRSVPAYVLYGTLEEESAEIAFAGMNGGL